MHSPSKVEEGQDKYRMEIIVNHLGAVQFEIQCREHRLLSDQPEANGGFNEGMTPPEFLLAALGSCAAYYAVEYLKARKLDAGGTRVKVTAEKAKNPARLDDFKIEVTVTTPLTEIRKEGILRAVDKCIVHNTLLHCPRITTEVASILPTLA